MEKNQGKDMFNKITELFLDRLSHLLLNLDYKGKTIKESKINERKRKITTEEELDIDKSKKKKDSNENAQKKDEKSVVSTSIESIVKSDPDIISVTQPESGDENLSTLLFNPMDLNEMRAFCVTWEYTFGIF